MKELKKALKKCHDTAIGCDNIHYQFFKHLPFRSLDSLLCIFYHVWQLQQVLNNLSKWSRENGFKFSKTKTKCMHFCQSRKLHLDPELTLDGIQIEVVPEFKFLGFFFFFGLYV